jgi:transposase
LLPSTRMPAVIAPQSPLSVLGRAAIITLAADKQPIPLIAAKLDTSEKTVKKWVTRFEEDATMEDAERSGRPWKTPEEDCINIVVTAYLEKFITPKRIKALLDLRTISARSIRRILDAAGLFGRISRISPPLTEAHLKARIAWGEGYKHFEFEDWAKILWSDEASALCGNYGQVWVQRRVGEAWNPEYVTHREKHPDKVHMWGCFSAYGMGDLYLFEENLDGPLMVKILKECLLRSANRLFPPGQWFFQQDNDPKHKSHLVQSWIAQAGIDCMDWPSYSPDLNPIENLWADVKRRAEAYNPRNVEELKKALRTAWEETSPKLIKKLIKSMPKRLKLVREKHGWMTGY